MEYTSYTFDMAEFMALYSSTIIISIIVSLFLLISLWKIYVKADEPGWAVLVPFYNNYVLFEITFGSGWLFLTLLIPIVNVFMSIAVYHKLSKAFGHGIGFTLGMLFLPIIFIPILAFGDSEYYGPQ